MCNNGKAVKEDFIGAHATEAPTLAPEPGTVLETGDNSETGAEAYDFKEYDLNEYDLGKLDNKYDYGTYDEYGPLPSKAPTAYGEEVGPGVAAETDFSESTVSIAPRPRQRRGVCMNGMARGLPLSPSAWTSFGLVWAICH